jgi:hypothetical protein
VARERPKLGEAAPARVGVAQPHRGAAGGDGEVREATGAG